MHRRLQVTTFCQTNLTSTFDECEISLGSNLLNEKIIDFDMNSSSCKLSNAAHTMQVMVGFPDRRSIERPMLKENAVFPEFVCDLLIEESKCCKGTTRALYSTESNVAARMPLTSFIFLLLALLQCIL